MYMDMWHYSPWSQSSVVQTHHTIHFPPIAQGSCVGVTLCANAPHAIEDALPCVGRQVRKTQCWAGYKARRPANNENNLSNINDQHDTCEVVFEKTVNNKYPKRCNELKHVHLMMYRNTWTIGVVFFFTPQYKLINNWELNSQLISLTISPWATFPSRGEKWRVHL